MNRINWKKLTRRQAAYLLSGLLIVSALAFIVSGFLGTKDTAPIDYAPLSVTEQKQLVLGKQDALGRATFAHIQLKNADRPKKKRERLAYNPVGWHNYRFAYRDKDGTIRKTYLMDRGHLVAYQFSGLNDEPRNLVPETHWLNAGDYEGTDDRNPDSQLFYENQLSDWMYKHKEMYLDLEVVPIYTGDELLPRQIAMHFVGVTEAGKRIKISIRGSNKVVYSEDGKGEVVLDNVSPNAQINYQTGRAKPLVKGS